MQVESSFCSHRHLPAQTCFMLKEEGAGASYQNHKRYYSNISFLFFSPKMSKKKRMIALLIDEKCRRSHAGYWPIERCRKEGCGGCNLLSCYDRCKCGVWSTIKTWK